MTLNPRAVQGFKVICKQQLIKIWMISGINTMHNILDVSE